MRGAGHQSYSPTHGQLEISVWSSIRQSIVRRDFRSISARSGIRAKEPALILIAAEPARSMRFSVYALRSENSQLAGAFAAH